VLAHGGRFNKESWEKQARALRDVGFRVLAIDFRGYSQSHGPGQADIFTAPLHLDVLAAVRYLRRTGAKTESVVGGSLGGGAAGDASIASEPGEIERLVFLGASPNGQAEKLKAPALFILARDDANADGPRLPRIRANSKKHRSPKSWSSLMAPPTRNFCSKQVKESASCTRSSDFSLRPSLIWCP
jgi:pimeloyl-ACP methyl ester carboxylesterase